MPPKNILKTLVVILVVFFLSGILFGAYKFVSQPTPVVTMIPTPECQQDNDCILAIRTDQCCLCPEAVTRETLKTDKNLREYESGQNYTPPPNLQERCNRIDCQPCNPWNRVFCEKAKCIKRQFCGGIAGVHCPEGYRCKLDGNYPDAGGVCIFK